MYGLLRFGVTFSELRARHGMKRKWEEFTQTNNGRADAVRVSLNARGTFALNQKAVDLLGGTEAIVLLFDKANRLIGLKPSSPKVNHACGLKRVGASQSYFLRAKSFCNFYGIDIGDKVVFNDAQMEDGMIVLNLDNVTEVVRRARPVKYRVAPDEPSKPVQTKFTTLLRMKMPGGE